MKLSLHWKHILTIRFSIAYALTAGTLCMSAVQLGAQSSAAQPATSPPMRGGASLAPGCESEKADSAYIPVDSWVYPAVWRLYAMGYATNVYLGMRPWTRASVRHMLEETSDEIEDAETYGDSTASQAQDLFATLRRELLSDAQASCSSGKGQISLESSYSVMRVLGGTPLQDDFHLGSTVVNDYGRPFENGFNNYSGLSGYASSGRFLLYVRGEFQHAPSAAGYSAALASELSTDVDRAQFINPVTGLPYRQATIPMGPIAAATHGRLIEAYASVHMLGHEVSLGKQDEWLGPGIGAGMAYSNNAENIYSFRINRVDPLRIPVLSRVLGPFRYEFLVGSVKGHTQPNDPWLHLEKVSFKPTRDLEFGFARVTIWGGKGHEPINLHSFLQSFFSFDSVDNTTKFTSKDPGARFGAFDFSYRLPFPRNWLTLYADMEAHDAVSPLFKPRHGTYRPGLYLSHVPKIPNLDARVEVVNTDSSFPLSTGGHYQYWEQLQVQGYTNKGHLLGDWIGREDKGGQAWFTYHLSGNEWIQAGARHQKASKDFIAGGTTLNDVNFQIVKRIGKDFEVNGSFTYERYKAPIYLPTQQSVTSTSVQLTWFPGRKLSF